jgi:ribonuclease G
MVKKILFSATPTEKRAALLEDGKVVELVVERPDQYRLVGNIYRGKIVSILPGIQAAFVDVGLDKSAFLHASDVDPTVLLEKDDAMMERYMSEARSKRRRIPAIPIEKVLSKGQEILVQVAKEPIGTKGAKVTTQISLAGRFLVLVPDTEFIGVSKRTSDFKQRRHLKQLVAKLRPRGIGFIVRTIGTKVSETEFVKEIHYLIDEWKNVQKAALQGSGPSLVHAEKGITTSVIRDIFSEDVSEVYVDNHDDHKEVRRYLETVSPELCKRVVFYTDRFPLFDKFDVEKDLDRSLRRKVWLKSGGYILFDHAEALMAIDVNTGRNVGKTRVDETIFRTNMEAAKEIVRQLRLRDIGGLIVVDFIDMVRAEHRRRVEECMRDILRKDQTAASMTGLSKFCLMEITRKRVRPELRELYTDVCHTCNGLGWVFSPATVSTRIDRWLRRTSSKKAPRELSLAVHPSVAGFLMRENKQVIRMLEKQHKIRLKVTENHELEADEFQFFAKGQAKPISTVDGGGG